VVLPCVNSIESQCSFFPRQKLDTRARLYARLRELGIKVFDRFDPLRVGIHHDILALLEDEFAPAEINDFLGSHCRRHGYLNSVARGHPRVDLDGSAAGAPADEERASALKVLTLRASLARYPAASRKEAA
jgi:sRNA-binding protein